jgi:hypothetical protein
MIVILAVLLFLMPLMSSAHAAEAVAPAVAMSTSAAPAPLFPPKPPARAKTSLDSAVDVARDLAAAVEYFEAGQSYYRAYTKGSHTPEENKAFIQFLQDYEKEREIARKTHAILGSWIEKKSSIRD